MPGRLAGTEPPVVHLAGDLVACREVESLIPATATTCVKEGLTPDSLHMGQALTLTLSPVKARETIREDVATALRRADRPSPFHVEPPYEMRTQFENEKMADWAMGNYDELTRIDETTVAYGGDEFRLVL